MESEEDDLFGEDEFDELGAYLDYYSSLNLTHADFEQQFTSRETFSADLHALMNLLTPSQPKDVVIDACKEIVTGVTVSLRNFSRLPFSKQTATRKCILFAGMVSYLLWTFWIA